LIFSLLNIRKKTAAILAGISLAALSLWGLSMWQNISLAEMLSILGGTLIMIGTIMLGAFLFIALIKLLLRIWQKARSSKATED
jgi:hypothetical protein|tara:strand:+ start:1208 stop:1459 length:252 start_codon:yes stop_codon:yes gene_type:complete